MGSRSERVNIKNVLKNESYKSKIVVDKASKCMRSNQVVFYWKGLTDVRFRNFGQRGFRYGLIDNAKLHLLIKILGHPSQ